jgi:hypothetical protein
MFRMVALAADESAGKIVTGAGREAVSMKTKNILTRKQLAGRLQVEPTWVYEMCRRRAGCREKPMACACIGRHLRYYWPDICEWLRSGDKVAHKEVRNSSPMEPGPAY